MRMGKYLFLVIFIFLVACGEQIETNMSEPAPEFDFTTQDAESLGSKDLQGNWWIAYFMYTNCRTVCPRTTANMVDLQKTLKEDDLNPRIVSFSVDPSYDTPKVLKDYAEEYGADLDNWSFLTGYEFETIQEISQTHFNAVLESGAASQLSHSYNFYLINPEGTIVKQYDGMSRDKLDDLADDIKTVSS